MMWYLFIAGMAICAVAVISDSKESADTKCAEGDTCARMAVLEEKVCKMERDNSVFRMEVEKRLAELEKKINTAQINHPDETNTNARACERGMADSVNKSFVIMSHGAIRKQIRCDAQTDAGGWIVIQIDTWISLAVNVGELHDFCKGFINSHVFETGVSIAKVLGHLRGISGWETKPSISSQVSYRLHLGSYSGTIGENGTYSGMSYGNNSPFSTPDQDNDNRNPGSCAVDWHGGWWYDFCTGANLNGKWGKTDSNGLYWYTARIQWVYPELIEMKIRRV